MMDDWQPIDTAPKDGSSVLICVDGKVMEAYFHAGPESAYDDVIGWYAIYAQPGDGFESGKGLDPSHWMHLPKQPLETV